MAVFTPDDEPYLGCPMVHHFDQIIVAAMDQQHVIGPWTRRNSDRLTRLQVAASQLIPGACSIALGVRELIRQAYLFPGFMLLRPLLERTATISYLVETPAALDLWEQGWPYSERPRLPELLVSMKVGKLPADQDNPALTEARTVTSYYNSLVHGDPVSAQENIMVGSGGDPTFSVSKDLESPDKADTLATHGAMYLVILMARGAQIFPEAAASDH